MKNLSLRNNRSNYLSDFFSDPFDAFFRPMFRDNSGYSMKTDIAETDKGYTLEIDLPGYSKDDIKLDFENGYLTVSASQSAKEEDKKNYIRRERSVSASRSYYIGDVDENSIKAKFDSGVLSVIIPKQEEEKPAKKNITIE